MASAPKDDLNTTIRLVRSVQDGNEDALDRLLERHLPRIRQAVASRMGLRLRQLFDHEDAVQGVLLRVLRGVDHFEHREEGSFRSWLARCVEHELVDLLRGAERQKRGGGRVRRFGDCPSSLLPSAIFADDSPTPSQLAQAEELADSVETHLLGMPEHYREVIVLRSVCGMSFVEIAREMGFTHEGSARMAFHRAAERLREAIGV